MYCYDSIWINGQRRGQIEHGIEKKNSEKSLSDCMSHLQLSMQMTTMERKHLLTNVLTALLAAWDISAVHGKP